MKQHVLNTNILCTLYYCMCKQLNGVMVNIDRTTSAVFITSHTMFINITNLIMACDISCICLSSFFPYTAGSVSKMTWANGKCQSCCLERRWERERDVEKGKKEKIGGDFRIQEKRIKVLWSLEREEVLPWPQLQACCNAWESKM